MSDSPYPSQTQDKFVLRLPDGMRDRIKHAAETNNRSMNAEIVATLEEKYPPPEPAKPEHPVLAAFEEILAAVTNDPTIRWRECISHHADMQGLDGDDFDAFRDWKNITIRYRNKNGGWLSQQRPFPLEDTIAEWLAQIEHSETEAEFRQSLAEFNEFLADDYDRAQFEAVIDPDGTSPRLSGRAVVLRLKP